MVYHHHSIARGVVVGKYIQHGPRIIKIIVGKVLSGKWLQI
jgi:hypothetical protein